MAVSAVKGKSTPTIAKQLASAKNIVAKGMTEKQGPRIYATVDKGRLHLAVDKDYAESIDCYTNWFTQLIFVRILGRGEAAYVNGITYYVNSKSLRGWVDQNVAASEEESSKPVSFLNFNQLKIKPQGDKGLMRDHLSVQKTQELFERMVTALVNNDSRTAEECLGSGARVDDYFWVRDHKKYPISFVGLKDGLPEDKSIPGMDAGRYTALGYVADKGNKAFADRLIYFGADPTLTSETVVFKKQISLIDDGCSAKVVKREQYAPEGAPARTKLTIKTTLALHIEDTVTPKETLSYDTSTNSLIRQPSTSPVTTKSYERIQETYTPQYIPKS